ncbi:hypothetical protein [Chamaesiphon sp.]|uniref:hypothetical protein n=1 Tax=Chamaesiphon sp. TaxID=2814140 RepID=UPI003593E27C
MKLNIVQSMSNLRRYLMQAIGTIVVTIACWQGLSIGVDAAIAASVQPGLDRSTSIVTQVANLEREPGQMEQVVKDDKNPARSLLNTAETGVKIDADKAEKPMGDTPSLVKETADRNAKQAGEFSEKTTKKVKNFFGF